MSFIQNRKPKPIHRFECTNCKGTVTVDFNKVKRGHMAICRSCGAEYPFNESDERLVRKYKKTIK